MLRRTNGETRLLARAKGVVMLAIDLVIRWLGLVMSVYSA